MKRTKAEAAETREAILDAAEQVFMDHGVNQASLNEIANLAGVTRGAVYFHFRDKVHIFQSLIERVRFPQEDILQHAAITAHPNPLEVLKSAIQAMFAAFVTDKRQQNIFTIINMRCVYVDEMTPIVQRLQQVRADITSLFFGLLNLLAERQQLSPAWTAENAACALLATIDGLLNEWLRSESQFNLTACGNLTVSALLDAFVADRAHENTTLH